MARTGVWLIGARGSVATTAIAGAAAVRAGAAPPTGCVSELPDFAGAGLPAWGDLVFGGHDIVDTPLVRRVEQLVRGGVIPAGLADLVWTDLTVAEGEIRDGTNRDPARLIADIASFRRRNRVERVVVVNVASTEPACVPHPAHNYLADLDRALHSLPASSLYAYAAMRASCAYVDFTPSTGAWLPALDELAQVIGVPYAGRDGKTGESLLRSVLAPMFARRALDVLSWSGTNLLGGGDGATLADPAAAAAKDAGKRRVLEGELGAPVDGRVHIDHVPALGDWKTSWDHVLFEGFLGTRMTLQVTWQGCDSALAAPLVLDLARFMAVADEPGPVQAMGFFFKDPVGTGPHGLVAQYDALRDWAFR
ncbi:inositol-3-phosphate synthase [Umezawaea sp. Da 62-37]|uniref:inositol-3-phosphate synthase n=1 Tax=Umezawaea sp. Da 62-37 TaxID=3075927 RepID=UPI0028F6CB09|nr:inositol-3-phosphate synthase [Umezawaea sp. Da 62-37]WNV84508.1 inositol-3-phosphate synthase [Umezawaea sp. Da 62-37]